MFYVIAESAGSDKITVIGFHSKTLQNSTFVCQFLDTVNYYDISNIERMNKP